MARRLSQMTEDALLEGGRSARRNIEHAGFSDDLKKELEERVKAASFKSEHAAAHSILDLPVCVTSRMVVYLLTHPFYSQAQAKVREKPQQLRHGQETRAYTIQLYECSTTPANQSVSPTRSPTRSTSNPPQNQNTRLVSA